MEKLTKQDCEQALKHLVLWGHGWNCGDVLLTTHDAKEILPR